MFLTPQEIQAMTGYQASARQIAWLKSRGWCYEVTKAGKPCVLRSHAESMLSGQSTKKAWSPNLAALKKVA